MITYCQGILEGRLGRGASGGDDVMLTRNPGWMPQEGCSEGDDVIYKYNVN